MNRRSLLKSLASLPLLGFLKPTTPVEPEFIDPWPFGQRPEKWQIGFVRVEPSLWRIHLRGTSNPIVYHEAVVMSHQRAITVMNHLEGMGDYCTDPSNICYGMLVRE